MFSYANDETILTYVNATWIQVWWQNRGWNASAVPTCQVPRHVPGLIFTLKHLAELTDIQNINK